MLDNMYTFLQNHWSDPVWFIAGWAVAKYYYIRSSRDTEQKHNELKKLQNLSLLHSDLVAKGLRCEVNRDEKGEPEAIGVFLEAKLEGTSTLTVKDNQVVVPTVKK